MTSGTRDCGGRGAEREGIWQSEEEIVSFVRAMVPESSLCSHTVRGWEAHVGIVLVGIGASVEGVHSRPVTVEAF